MLKNEDVEGDVEGVRRGAAVPLSTLKDVVSTQLKKILQ